MNHSLTIEENLVRACLAGESSGALLEQWIYWNNSPSRHVPLKTLLSFFPESLYRLLPEDFRVRRKIDTILRSKLSWHEAVSWAPQDPLFEIGLLAPVKFERLALLSAALIMRQSISQVIDGSTVRRLRQEIGGDILEFALLSSWPLHHDLVPDGVPSQDIVASIQQKAITVVEDAFSGKEKAIQVRIASKLPGCFAKGWLEGSVPLAEESGKLILGVWKEASSWL